MCRVDRASARVHDRFGAWLGGIEVLARGRARWAKTRQAYLQAYAFRRERRVLLCRPGALLQAHNTSRAQSERSGLGDRLGTWLGGIEAFARVRARWAKTR